ncbi:MAG: CHASE2 domain-containing protein [Candidatus Omnitrophota bacterium]|nr:CHASE2 domain-containing protein [Candidatus Omnitrophota bacterium]
MDISAIKNFGEFLYQKVVQHRRVVGSILSLVVVLIVVMLYQANTFSRLELLTLDYRFNLRHINTKPSDIVFIDMAEDSIAAIGRWPWPRKWHATLIKILANYHPKALAFDVIFSEPQDDADDKALEEALKQAGIVYFPMLYDLETTDLKNAYKGLGVSSILEPTPIFKAHVKGIGHINALPDLDGILRRVPAVMGHDGKYTYQLGMKVAFDAMGLTDNDVFFDPDRHLVILSMAGGKIIKVPLDESNQLVINWQGKWGKEFPHYSYIDVIRSYAAIQAGEKPIIDLNIFKDKICIIGLTAAGLIDIKPIPIENAYPAVGVNATVLYSIMDNDFIYTVPKRINILILLIVTAALTFFLSNLRPLAGMVFALISAVCYGLISWFLFSFFKISVVTFYPILGIFASYGLTAAYTQILQNMERSRLFKQATRDGLTHLYNIRHFNLLLEAEFKNVATYRFRKLSLLMTDNDNFKKVNDTYGHQAGDTILVEVAKILQSKSRQVDVVARYGGEEFIVMLTGAGEKDAAEVGEKIRTAVEAKKFKFKDVNYNATISIGVVEYSNEKNKDELIGKADSALYHAKHTGKNKVVIFSTIPASAGKEGETPPAPAAGDDRV